MKLNLLLPLKIGSTVELLIIGGQFVDVHVVVILNLPSSNWHTLFCSFDSKVMDNGLGFISDNIMALFHTRSVFSFS